MSKWVADQNADRDAITALRGVDADAAEYLADELARLRAVEDKATTKTKAKHTPLPWKVEIVPIPSAAEWGRNRPRYGLILAPDGVCIAETCYRQRENNARLIVRAVNSHQALMDALERLLRIVDSDVHRNYCGNPECRLCQAEAALALAKED